MSVFAERLKELRKEKSAKEEGERQTSETNEVKLHDFIRENFEIVEFDEDVIIFCDENEQTYEHDIV